MLAYALVALSAPFFLRKRGEPKMLAWILGVLGAVTMLFVFYVNWIPTAIANDIFAPLSGPYKWLPYIFIVWTVVGLTWYFAVRFRSPQVVANAAAWGEHAPGRSELVLAPRVLSVHFLLISLYGSQMLCMLRGTDGDQIGVLADAFPVEEIFSGATPEGSPEFIGDENIVI